MQNTFGEIIRQARQKKGYSQKELAEEIGIDFTSLSRMESNTAHYTPKESTIRALAVNLSLDSEELIFLAGRIPQKDSELLKSLKIYPDWTHQASDF
ncbi:MAG: helix-turn-helix transcriptional regulator [Prochloraceae cyanobacterium]|nr:helix-turn-helix transcriptional regulator [Prochloraceae cyanobacterium]